MKLRLVNKERGRGREFRAALEVDGQIVGRVERGWSMGGRRANSYVAKVGRWTCAEAETLGELLAELREDEAAALREALELAAL